MNNKTQPTHVLRSRDDNEDLSPVLWVAKACNPNDQRRFCAVIHVNDDGRVLATDGARLHQAWTNTLDPGDYQVKRTNNYRVDLYPVDNAALPDVGWEMIENTRKNTEPVTGWQASGDLTNNLYRLIYLVGPLDKGKTLFNAWLLADALEGASEVARAGKDKIYLASGIHEALVVGRRA